MFVPDFFQAKWERIEESVVNKLSGKVWSSDTIDKHHSHADLRSGSEKRVTLSVRNAKGTQLSVRHKGESKDTIIFLFCSILIHSIANRRK